MPDGSPIQRRQHNRYAITFPVIFSGDTTGQGQAADVSVLGCAVDADQTVEAKTYLKLELSLPDGDAPLEIELAVVRWSHQQKFGMEFIAFGEAQKKRLMRFLSQTANAQSEQNGTQAA